MTHDENSPTAPFHMAASKVMQVSHLIAMVELILKKHYAPIRIHCVNALVNKDI